MAPPDPDPARLRALLLREAVRRHVTGERRRRFAPVLHVGRPGVRERTVAAALTTTDHALRCDLVAAMAAGCDDDPLVWLTRPGELDREDVDVAWAAATRAAAAEAGRTWACVVVTRRGWRDPVTGEGRTWARLRG